MEKILFKNLIQNQSVNNLHVFYEIQRFIKSDSIYKNVRLLLIPRVEFTYKNCNYSITNLLPMRGSPAFPR